MKKNILFICVILITTSLHAQTHISGIVYLDENQNLKMDSHEKGLKDVLVSNGKEVIKSDKNGLKIRKTVPAGLM